MCSGIYMIKNMINNKVYIGQAVNIERRWHDHISELNENKHINTHLQRAWNKYGSNNFIFSIVEKCSEEELNDREIYYIAKYKAHNRKYGYNKTYGGSNGRPTDEIRAKMSKIKKEQYKNPVERAKMSKSKATLSKEDVLQIVGLFVTKHYSMCKLGKMFNVDVATIAPIINNTRFHIYDNEINTVLAKYNLTRADLKGMKRKANNKRKLSKKDVLNIINLYLYGYSQRKIANMYNMSDVQIGRLINGDTYKQYNDEIQQMIDNFYGDNVKQA